MRVIGYTYEAAIHCVDCTKIRFQSSDGNIDENGISEEATDNEGNPVHAVSEGAEWDYQPGCDSCFVLIDGIQVLEYNEVSI